MIKSLIAFLTLLAEIIRMLIARRLSPTRRQTEEDIDHETARIQNDVAKSRSCGNDAGADALLRRLRGRIQIESIDPDNPDGERSDSDAPRRQ